MELNGESLSNYILSLPKEKRVECLKNNDIRNKYLESRNHYPFVWLVQSLKEDDLIYFIDNNYLEKILLNERNSDKINAILSSGNVYANLILSNTKALEFILKSYLITYIYSMNYIFGQALLDYALEKKDMSIVGNVGRLHADQQLKTFTNEYIVKIMELNSNDNSFLFSLDGKVINKFILYQPYLNEIIKGDINKLNYIVKEKHFIFPNYLLNNQKLINKYASINNSNIYRETINTLMQNNYNLVEKIEYYRKIYVKNKFNNINEDGYFKKMDKYFKDNSVKVEDDFSYEVFFKLRNLHSNNDINGLKQKYRELTEKLQLEMIVDTYFKDITFNFLANLKTILEYINEIDEKIISIDNIKLYKKIYNFHNLSNQDRKDLISLFNDDIDYAKMFYEDFSKCRNHSYDLMNKKVLKLDKNSYLYNKKQSTFYGVDIYELNGEDFFAYVHSTSCNRSSNTVNWLKSAKTISLSFIGSNNIDTYYYGKSIIFGFLYLNPQNIMHTYNSDSYTSHQYGTDKINRIYTPERFIKETKGYNEILYSEKNLDNFKPDFIMCYDYITDGELNIARDMNIPIIKIDSKKYSKIPCMEPGDVNNYLNSFQAEKVEKYY